MISAFPLPQCPACDYSLKGHASGGRCPECGFAWDEKTLVFRPSRPWKTLFGLLAIEIVLLWLLSASALTFLGALVRADWAVVIVLLIAVIVLGSTFLIVWKANHKSRFAAITPKGIVVRNLGSLTHIPFEEISLVATNDIVPWIQKRDGQRISLRGIVANSQERRLFKEAAASDRADKNTESGRQKIQKTPATDRPRKSTPLRLTYVGVSILAVAIIGMLVFGFGLGTKVDADSLVGAAVAVFWGGVVIALVGQWRSDKQTSKPEPSSKKKE